jgi:hypothetical protein
MEACWQRERDANDEHDQERGDPLARQTAKSPDAGL